MTIIRETKMYDGRRILTAWERVEGTCLSHGTITTIDGVWHGSITTRRLPAHLDALPYGDERITAVRAYHESLRQEAYSAILAARPDAKQGIKNNGEIYLPL